MKGLFNLSKKIAVVTGGAGLLGRSFVKALAENGASVYVADIQIDKAARVSQELSSCGLAVEAIRLDISDEKSITDCIGNIVGKKSALDIWVNNAYPRTPDWNLAFEKIPIDSWRKNVDQHLNGYALCCQKAVEQMRRQKKGSIINIASIYGIVGPDFSVYEGTPMTMPAAYSAIKGGLINLTRYLASYYGSFGVRVNAISPGGIQDDQPETFVKAYSRKTPLGRMAHPEDLAGAVVFLASEASSYVTGHNLVVDGGWTVV